MRRLIIVAAGLTASAVAGCAVAGCGSSSSSSPAASATTRSTGVSTSGAITVFAAASLQGSFTQLGQQFEALHPGSKVTFSFGPSSGLATQIIDGAPADVFASAAVHNMNQVVSAGKAAGASDFARNKMEIAVPPGNPGHVSSVHSLSKSSVKVAVCQPQVPCGVVAKKVFSKASVSVTPVTLETDVKSVLTKVELGDVDAGMVYVTDVKAAGSKVKGVAIPASENATTTYPIATISKSSHAATARAFVNYVMSPAGEKVLAADGFEKP
jgi:molybdate transport system substrate-binding protein